MLGFRRHLRSLGLIAAVSSIALAACSSGGASSAPTTGTTSTGGSAGASAAGSSAASGAGSSGAANGSALPVALPPAETTSGLTIGLSNNLAVGQFLDQFAVDLGLFKKYGLDVKVVPFEGDGKLLQAVVAGQVEGAESSGGSAISAAITDTPLVVTTLNNTGLPYDLVGGKDIKTGADLKGKIIATSSLGSVAHAVILAALKTLNVDPKDVTISPVGSESARIAAVVAGSVAAAPVTTTNAKPLVAKGLNILVDLTEQHIQYATAGLTFRKDWIAKNPNTALRMIAAILEAQKTLYDNPDLAAQKYVDFTQVKPDVAKAAVDAYIKTEGNKGLYFSAEAFQIPKQVTVSVNPAAANVDVNSVFDLQYLDKLKRLGFNQAINFP